ncbi:helix-turn-helix domain-containing protein [Empedobacter tilapiae]|uniref:helix-turn-helix domain-containing protein n=1 Tax=Empedobacter tilapiae TaxID=2491114 RepID=UPI0028D0F01D|nr:helix-turn-helix domain-containing protein [Empedobacter tilapiae]
MKSLQFIGLEPKTFIEDLKSALIPELQKRLSKEFQPKQPTEYLTRSEVCQLLKIDLSTLHNWRNRGILEAYGIGNRVYFKRSEIENYIEQNKLNQLK